MPIPLYYQDKCYVVSQELADVMQEAGWSRTPIIRTAKPIWPTPALEATLMRQWKVVKTPEKIELDIQEEYNNKLFKESETLLNKLDVITVIDKIEANPLPKLDIPVKEPKNGKRKTSRR